MAGEIEVDGQGYDHDVMMLVNNIEIGAGAVVVAGEIEVHGPGCDHDVMI